MGVYIFSLSWSVLSNLSSFYALRICSVSPALSTLWDHCYVPHDKLMGGREKRVRHPITLLTILPLSDDRMRITHKLGLEETSYHQLSLVLG